MSKLVASRIDIPPRCCKEEADATQICTLIAAEVVSMHAEDDR